MLRDMVRTTMIHTGDEMGADEMTDTIMRIFLQGVRAQN